jgi:hypothetical protein
MDWMAAGFWAYLGYRMAEAAITISILSVGLLIFLGTIYVRRWRADHRKLPRNIRDRK